MNESELITVDDWSALDTVSDFDAGAENVATTKRHQVTFTRVNSLLVESLIEQLIKLLEKDPLHQRRIYEVICAKLFEMNLVDKTYNIKELASLRNHYQQALVNLMTLSVDSNSLSPVKLEWSRYHTEYEEICFVAAGGFGQVFKAKHLLDQVVYAVKKIPLKFVDVSKLLKKLSEVKTLAQLNHPNIVQYKAAWLEPLFSDVAAPSPPVTLPITSVESDGIIFKHSNSEYSNCASISDEKINNNLALCQYKESPHQQTSKQQVKAVLYVSMRLCDKTLREWLNERNCLNNVVDIPLALNVLMQVALGIQYIHSSNIVHHDIKPSNIFISDDVKLVQVGDFGLSCCLQGHDRGDCPLESGNCGTPLYAAPEQLKGRCDSKSDIFSLGLIFIELMTVFSTEMERANVLTKVRSGILPSGFPVCFIPMAMDLISSKPQVRPTASQLIARLKRFLTSKVPNGPIIQKCPSPEEPDCEADELADVRRKNQLLEKELKEKEIEIFLLKQMLAERDKEMAKFQCDTLHL